MQLYIKIKKRSAKEIFYYLFLVFCFIPFLFPNPIVRTNVQPYAALLGTLIVVFRFNCLFRSPIGRKAGAILGVTLLSSLFVMLIGGVSVEALRGVYNYYALFVIPCAVIIVLEDMDDFPETLCKTMIVLWFIVASIQFFIYRGFATQLISSVRWSYRYRGVVGLASEPSFLGITCFYFLHLIRRFKTHRVLFNIMTLIMGVLYAQSATGIMFIAGYYIVFLLDVINSRKGVYVWAGSIVAAASFLVYLNNKLTGSRLNQMVDAFLNGGVDNVLSDGSASIRINAIWRALENAAGNMFLPNGFGSRIGSAYGGMLVEIGLFAIPAIILISFGLSVTFNKTISKVVYFIVTTLLLLNNTQIGNPLLLLVIGTNLRYLIQSKRTQEVISVNDKIYQSA